MNAIIPARGGSTRIPRKNVIDICGHPLVAWSIMQAKAAKGVSRVWVTTDDDEIAEISQQYGATVIRRPEWMRDSKWTASVPLRHALEYIDDCGWETPEFINLLPTDPLRLPGDIDRMHAAFCNATAEDGQILQALMMAPLQDVSLYTRRDETMASLYFHDKAGQYLQYTSGMSIFFTQDYWEQERRMAEHFGAENLTDAEIDKQFNERQRTPADDIATVWAESQEWQKYCLDLPREIEFVRDLMELKILKGRKAEEVYENIRR